MSVLLPRVCVPVNSMVPPPLLKVTGDAHVLGADLHQRYRTYCQRPPLGPVILDIALFRAGQVEAVEVPLADVDVRCVRRGLERERSRALMFPGKLTASFVSCQVGKRRARSDCRIKRRFAWVPSLTVIPGAPLPVPFTVLPKVTLLLVR